MSDDMGEHFGPMRDTDGIPGPAPWPGDSGGPATTDAARDAALLRELAAEVETFAIATSYTGDERRVVAGAVRAVADRVEAGAAEAARDRSAAASAWRMAKRMGAELDAERARAAEVAGELVGELARLRAIERAGREVACRWGLRDEDLAGPMARLRAALGRGGDGDG